ncbi:MAG TPA: PAS domain S-box protein, partial [Solirubrobacteraceae bacterium]
MSTHQDIDRERRLFELVRDPLFVSTAEGRVVSANRAGLDLLGLTEAELASRPYSELLHPDDLEAAERQVADILAGGRAPAPFRVRIVRSDGETRWVEAQSSLDPVSGLIYSVVHDVTDREETFMDRLAGAFRDAPLGMALVAPGGAFLRVNSTLCRMLGRTEPELLAESLTDLVEDESVRQALRDGAASVQIETPMRHREGRPVIGLVSATLVRDIRGEPQYYVCQVLDMTERYEAQADLAANEAKLAEAQQIAR